MIPKKFIDKLFNYDDYRVFLKDFFQAQKQARREFSHRYFANKAGISNPSYIHYVIKGRYNLTEKSIDKILKGLTLVGTEAKYFKLLVLYNQETNPGKKGKLSEELDLIRKSRKNYKIKAKEYGVFNEWYYPVIRVMAEHSNWNGDIKKLASMIVPPITAQQAQKAVDTLVESGLLKEKKGKYSATSTAISAEDTPSVYIKKSRKDLIMNCALASEQMQATKRHTSYTIVGTTKENFDKISSYLDEVRATINAMVQLHDEVEDVYVVNLNAVPLSNSEKNK